MNVLISTSLAAARLSQSPCASTARSALPPGLPAKRTSALTAYRAWVSSFPAVPSGTIIAQTSRTAGAPDDINFDASADSAAEFFAGIWSTMSET